MYVLKEYKMVHLTLENNLAIFYKVKQTPIFDSAVPTLTIYPKEVKAHVHRELAQECS
jgi:hypothetical protein